MRWRKHEIELLLAGVLGTGSGSGTTQFGVQTSAGPTYSGFALLFTDEWQRYFWRNKFEKRAHSCVEGGKKGGGGLWVGVSLFIFRLTVAQHAPTSSLRLEKPIWHSRTQNLVSNSTAVIHAAISLLSGNPVVMYWWILIETEMMDDWFRMIFYVFLGERCERELWFCK